MFEGRVDAIYLAGDAGAAVQSVEEVRAIEGRGLEGDRYAGAAGTYSDDTPGRHVTFIEQEAISSAAREYGVEFGLGESRRNIVTSGVPLNHLVGREFAVGDVVLRGVRLCEPCGALQDATGKPVVKMLRHRGGLRADIVRAGLIRVGDAIRPC
jgi:MOSC domain-containing protein YiiM